MNDLDKFYENVCDLTDKCSEDVSPTAKTIALFRVAFEYGASHMGVPTLGYMMSRLLAITLAFDRGSPYTSYASILEEFEGEEDHTTH